jgi:hypothetical protein
MTDRQILFIMRLTYIFFEIPGAQGLHHHGLDIGVTIFGELDNPSIRPMFIVYRDVVLLHLDMEEDGDGVDFRKDLIDHPHSTENLSLQSGLFSDLPEKGVFQALKTPHPATREPPRVLDRGLFRNTRSSLSLYVRTASTVGIGIT